MPVDFNIGGPDVDSNRYDHGIEKIKAEAEAAMLAAMAALKRNQWRDAAGEGRKAMECLAFLEGEHGKLY